MSIMRNVNKFTFINNVYISHKKSLVRVKGVFLIRVDNQLVRVFSVVDFD
jgi:hypothetical protein